MKIQKKNRKFVTHQKQKIMPTVKTIKIKDIKDNDQLYVVIENNGKKEAINVGIKTYERIEQLINPKQAELPLKENDKNNKK